MIRHVCASSCVLLSLLLSGRPAAAQTSPPSEVPHAVVGTSDSIERAPEADPIVAKSGVPAGQVRLMPSVKDLFAPLPGSWQRHRVTEVRRALHAQDLTRGEAGDLI